MLCGKDVEARDRLVLRGRGRSRLAMSDFQPLLPHQLAQLSDDELVDYIRAAREAGAAAAERDAVGYLAFAFEPTIRGWVRRRTPPQDVDDVVMEVLASAIKATFDGKVVGEFGSFLKRISQRRVADYFRDGERRLNADPLPDEHEGDDDYWGAGPSEEDETADVALRDAVDRVLATRNALHRQVISLYGSVVAGFEDLPADEVSARIAADGSGETVSVDNVAKIGSRFMADLREELGA